MARPLKANTRESGGEGPRDGEGIRGSQMLAPAQLPHVLAGKVKSIAKTLS